MKKKGEGSSYMPKEGRYALSHSKNLSFGELEQGVNTHSSIILFNNLAFVSQIEPKSKDAKNDKFWILDMQEELNQFEMNKIGELVRTPSLIFLLLTPNEFLEIKLMKMEISLGTKLSL